MTSRQPDPDRTARESRGRWSEHYAALSLMLRGYRILARRYRSPQGEIDIIARRGRRIAYIEVKYRATLAEAEAALRPQQARRVAAAASHWISRNPRYADYDQGFDAIMVLPWGWPILVPDAYQPVGTSGRMW